MSQAMKGGIGSYTVPRIGPKVMVAALVATNPFGDVIDPKSGKVVAGSRKAPDSREYLDATGQIIAGSRLTPSSSNTILGVVATNVRLTKSQATTLAALAQHGMIRTVSPVHTIVDGDLVFAMSVGGETTDFISLGVAAADALIGSYFAQCTPCPQSRRGAWLSLVVPTPGETAGRVWRRPACRANPVHL